MGPATLLSEVAGVRLSKGTHKDLHLLVKPVVHDERMAHPYTRRLHPANSFNSERNSFNKIYLRVSRTIVKTTYIRIEKVTLRSRLDQREYNMDSGRRTTLFLLDSPSRAVILSCCCCIVAWV